MIKKPKDIKVFVTYRDDYDTWYPAELKDRLSSQFTCEFKIKGKQQYGFYFYKDRNITWKDRQ